MGNVTFVLNRSNVRELLLLGLGNIKIEEVLVTAAKEAAPAGTEVNVSRSYGPGGRIRVRIVDTSSEAVDKDANTGHLQQALNRVKV
jgi:hypothetical protein